MQECTMCFAQYVGPFMIFFKYQIHKNIELYLLNAAISSYSKHFISQRCHGKEISFDIHTCNFYPIKTFVFVAIISKRKTFVFDLICSWSKFRLKGLLQRMRVLRQLYAEADQRGGYGPKPPPNEIHDEKYKYQEMKDTTKIVLNK